MQMVIAKIGWVLRQVLGTTAPESLCAAANIFIGQVVKGNMIRQDFLNGLFCNFWKTFIFLLQVYEIIIGFELT